MTTEQIKEWKELNNIMEVAVAKEAGMEIEYRGDYDTWQAWDGVNWYKNFKYRARYKPTKYKMLAYLSDDYLIWKREGFSLLNPQAIRVPSEDKIIYIEGKAG